jgi:hypothetical protein
MYYVSAVAKQAGQLIRVAFPASGNIMRAAAPKVP